MSAKVLEHPVVQLLLVLLSLGATPLVVFICSSNSLYLTNQAELHYQMQVLLPFLKLFHLTVLIGVLLWILSAFRPIRYLLCAYYVLGPFYLVFLFLQKISLGYFSFIYVFDTPAGVLLLLGAFIALVARFAPRFTPPAAAKPFAVFTCFLMTVESISFVSQRQAPPAPVSGSLADMEGRPDLPNIYHIIFDGYQTDFLSLALTPEISRALKGFIWFNRAAAHYELTEMSLPSIFTGAEFARDVSMVDYMRRGYDTEASFLHPLKKKGYLTIAYLPIGYRSQSSLLDRVVSHRNNAREEQLVELNTATFKRLWLYASAPRYLTRWLMDTEWFIQYGDRGDLRLIKNERFLAYSRPVASYLSFLNVLEQEPLLPESGRYTLVHAFIPHPPDVLGSDCSYGDRETPSGPLEQTRCAMKLLLELIHRLEDLGRFDDSLIVVHGDHGGFYRLENGALVPTETTSLRALLLIKPIGSRLPFFISDAEASLLDIAPTILGAVGAESDSPFDGSVLTEAINRD